MKWEPFVRATHVNVPSKMMELAHQFKIKPEEREIWINNIYQVMVMRNFHHDEWPEMIALSIKRRDKQAIRDWRDFQRIKNEIVGPEHEAVELYPAESRLVDSANQYFLFVFTDAKARFPFGFTERFVTEEASFGTQQRPWRKGEKPKDLKTVAQYCAEKGVKVPE